MNAPTGGYPNWIDPASGDHCYARTGSSRLGQSPPPAERDAYLLGVGRAIAYIEHTTALAQQFEPERNARIIGEWSMKVVTAIRMAAADITGGSK